MHASFHYLRDIRPSELSAADVKSLLANALTLQRSSGSPHTHRLLLGKRLAVVSEGNTDASQFFELVASDLGAHVSRISPHLAELEDPSGFENTARILGRLYHAIECQGLNTQVLLRLERAVLVPVYDGVACPGHPIARLADQLEVAESAESKRRLVLQAVLVSTLGSDEM